jgi:DnaJ-class molecular chaperone
MEKTKKICPRCLGNGYLRIPNKSVDVPKQVTVNCTMCDSQGEVHLADPGPDTAPKLQ